MNPDDLLEALDSEARRTSLETVTRTILTCAAEEIRTLRADLKTKQTRNAHDSKSLRR